MALDDVTAHLLSQGLGTRKLPEQLELLEAIPRNATGKVLKHVLRDELKG